MFFSVLEQFTVLPVLNNCHCNFAPVAPWVILISIFIGGYIFFLSLLSLSSKKDSLAIIPNNWQGLLELVHQLILSIVKENIKDNRAGKFFPLIITLFIFILLINLIGLLPYSYTLTAQFCVTLCLSLSIFIGINIISVKQHGLKFFALFIPSGTSVVLAFLLVPIELISYVFKPISLSIRLFANMMAGHTLLKVIAGFASTLVAGGGIFILLSYIPLFILIPLFGLEVAVAVLQSLVYVILICIYVQDALVISH